MYSNIIVDKITELLLTWYTFTNWPFGLKKLTFKNKRISEIGKIYKIFVIAKVICTCILSGLIIQTQFEIFYKYLPNPLKISVCLSITSLVICYISIVFNSVFALGGIYKNMFLKISLVIRNLNADDRHNFYQFKKWLIFIHFVQFLITLIYMIHDCTIWQSLNVIVIHELMFTTDLEILHFIIEVDLISTLLKFLNQNLMLERNNFRHPLMLISKPNRINQQNIVFFNGQEEKRIENFLLIFNQLADIIDGINSCYAVLASTKINYYM